MMTASTRSPRSSRDEVVRAVLASLTPESRRVLALCVHGGRSIAETARALALAERTVLAHLHAAMSAVRMALIAAGSEVHPVILESEVNRAVAETVVERRGQPGRKEGET